MYAEVRHNPVIESPLSYATAMHEMLLQSWGGVLRVFPATPEKWSGIAFKDLRTQGAFLVTAKKKSGETQFVSIKSLAGSPCVVQTDLVNPRIYIEGMEHGDSDRVRKKKQGLYEIDLEKGETVLLAPVALKDADLRIEPIDTGEENFHLFGLSSKTERLTGHTYYYEEL